MSNNKSAYVAMIAVLAVSIIGAVAIGYFEDSGKSSKKKTFTLKTLSTSKTDKEMLATGKYTPEPEVKVEPVVEAEAEAEDEELVNEDGNAYRVIRYSDGCYDYTLGDWRARECYQTYSAAHDNMISFYNYNKHDQYMSNRSDFEVVTQ